MYIWYNFKEYIFNLSKQCYHASNQLKKFLTSQLFFFIIKTTTCNVLYLNVDQYELICPNKWQIYCCNI